MKITKRIISILLCVLMCVSASVFAFANDDNILYAQLVERTLLGASSLFDNYTHDARFAQGYDIEDVIDVSEHNGSINWMLVKLSGIEGVMIRVGYRGYVSGKIVEDANFSANLNGAIAAGLKVGVYFYSQAITVKEAQEEAAFVVDRIKGKNITLPVAFDCEYAEKDGGFTGRLYEAKLSKAAQTEIGMAYCAYAENAGYKGMLYLNPFMLQDHFNASELEAKYSIWLARYNTSAGYSGKYDMWQYRSTGRVTGISGKVDMNYLYIKKSEAQDTVYIKITSDKTEITSGDYAQLSAFLNGEALSALGGKISNVEWTSSASNIASVDANGKVTAAAQGNAEITASVTVTFMQGDTKTFSDKLSISVVSHAVEPIVDPGTSQDDPEPEPEIEPGTETGETSIIEQVLNMIVDLIVALINFFAEIVNGTLA